MPSSYEHCSDCLYACGRQLTEADRAIPDRPLSMEDNGSDTLLVFQSPGIEEWKTGTPISSSNPRSAAAKMRKVFELVGSDRGQFNITNAVQCFPGKRGAEVGLNSRDRSPPAEVLVACSQWLETDIHKRSYKRVVVFGRVAEKMVRKLIGMDSRLLYVPHPSARGVSLARLAAALKK
jgi:uracil-DNA glycosylase family 4